MSPAMILLAAVAVVLILVAVWIIGLFNGLVRVKNACDESWADIDTELKRRHDLIPNLLETVKGYAAHEKEVFDSVVKARTAALADHNSPAAQARDENALAGSLRQLFALAEAYPDLKANQNFIKFQEELANTEDRLQRSSPFLQRQRPRSQQPPRSLPLEPRRPVVRLPEARILRDRRPRHPRNAGGEVLRRVFVVCLRVPLPARPAVPTCDRIEPPRPTQIQPVSRRHPAAMPRFQPVDTRAERQSSHLRGSPPTSPKTARHPSIPPPRQR